MPYRDPGNLNSPASWAAIKDMLFELYAKQRNGGGASGGSVESVNGQTGVVVLDAGDIGCSDPTTEAAGTTQGALEHLFQYANDGKTAIADAIGSPATSGNTFAELAAMIAAIDRQNEMIGDRMMRVVPAFPSVLLERTVT